MRLFLDFRSGFKVLLLLCVMSCNDLDRENPLDPKNPSSHDEPVYFIEAFVNTSQNLPTTFASYNKEALEAVNDIKNLYGDQVLVAEYHRNSQTHAEYADDLALNIRYEPLYTKYVTTNGEGQKGVPDIFINGAEHRIQGAYSASSTFDRLNDMLSGLLSETGEYTIEPRVELNEATISVHCKVARLGYRAADQLRIRLVFIRNFDAQHLKNVVVAEDEISKYSQSIYRISAGDFTEVNFDPISFTSVPDGIILVLSNNDETVIYHSTYVML